MFTFYLLLILHIAIHCAHSLISAKIIYFLTFFLTLFLFISGDLLIVRKSRGEHVYARYSGEKTQTQGMFE